MTLNLSKAVHYRSAQFAPARLNYPHLLPGMLAATEALTRCDQMLQAMHNSEVFLAPLRS
ncbi:MAG: hypothetical protein RJQ08_08070 [Salinisphaeraceae bacterium]